MNFNKLNPNDHIGNLNHAFDVAQNSFGIVKLLDAEGLILLLLIGISFFKIDFFLL
jgi:hypothetical protein